MAPESPTLPEIKGSVHMSLRQTMVHNHIRELFQDAPFSRADAEAVALRCGQDPSVIVELQRAGRLRDFGNGVMGIKESRTNRTMPA